MDDKKSKLLLVTALVAIIALSGISFWVKGNSVPGELDGFTLCLKEKGVTFYGAFWCSHCQNQKKLFGKSEKLLPYIECSTADGRDQLQICKDKKIGGYPTWEFADGSREDGELSLEKLSEKTGCQLPK